MADYKRNSAVAQHVYIHPLRLCIINGLNGKNNFSNARCNIVLHSYVTENKAHAELSKVCLNLQNGQASELENRLNMHRPVSRGAVDADSSLVILLPWLD